MCVAGLVTFAHDRREMLAHVCSPRQRSRRGRGGGAGHLWSGAGRWWMRLCGGQADCRARLWHDLTRWSATWSAYTYLVEIQSILLPLLFEVLMPFLQLPTWSYFVALTEMILSIRLLHEGTIAPPLRRLVAVIDEATPNMIALIIVLAPLSVLTSLMHSQLFGLFDDGYSDPFISLSRVVSMLTAPPIAANTEGVALQAQKSGAELLFYWSTFVIRLCFGSFIVAILVGAFNKVVQQERSGQHDRDRDASLPANYEDAAECSTCERMVHFVQYLFTFRSYGSFGPWLITRLETQIDLSEHADPDAKEQQLMLTSTELAALTGARPADLLLHFHGALRKNPNFQDEEDEEQRALEDEENQTSPQHYGGRGRYEA